VRLDQAITPGRLVRGWSRRAHLAAVAAAVPLVLAGCGSSGSSAPQASSGPSSAAAGPSATATTSGAAAAATTCDPVSGTSLVALADDKMLQNSDNIVPVVRTDVAKPPLTDALNAVSKALTQDALVGLNKSVDVDSEKPDVVADGFVKDSSLGAGLTGGSGTIKVVAADFSENVVIANVYAKVLTKAGYAASVQTLKNRELYAAALEKGDVQVVPEYAATATAFFAAEAKDTTTKASPDVTVTVAALQKLLRPKGLTVLEPAAANDQNAFAVTKAFADKYAVSTLSDLVTKCGGGLTLGGPAECPRRPFCQLGLQMTYGLKVSGFTSLDAGGPLSKNALKQGKVALALVFSSDASLGAS